MLIPLMASRLMLSLKKSAVESASMCTLSSMASPGSSAMSRAMRFSSRVPGGPPEVPGTPASPGFFEEGVELGSVSRTFRRDSYGHHVVISPAPRSFSHGMAFSHL